MTYDTAIVQPAGSRLDSYHGLMRRDVIRHVEGNCGRVLDFGGGRGATAVGLKRAGRASEAGVVDLLDAPDPEIDFAMAGDLNDIEFIDQVVAEQGPFDTILALDVLEHLIDPWSVMARLQRGLAPNGRLIISVPNARSYQLVLPLVFANRWTYRDSGILDRTHLRFFVKSSAIELVANSGLAVEKVASTTYGRRSIRLLRLLTLGLFNSFTDRQIVVIGRNR